MKIVDVVRKIVKKKYNWCNCNCGHNAIAQNLKTLTLYLVYQFDNIW